MRSRIVAIAGALAVLGGSLAAASRELAEADPTAVEGVDGTPGLAMAVQPDRWQVYPGDAVTMLVRIVNTGAEPVRRIVLTSSVDRIGTGRCSRRAIGDLLPGRSAEVVCPVSAPAAVFGFESAVTGSTRHGSVTDSVSVAAGGAAAALTAGIAPVHPQVRPGEDVRLRVRIRNTGAVALRAVGVLDPTIPDCSRGDLGTLAPGQQRDYTCGAPAGLDDATTVVVATGTPPGQPPAQAISPVARIDVIHPALALAVHGGSVLLANPGDVPVTRIGGPCGRTVALLAPGGTASYRCPVSARVTASGIALGARIGAAAAPSRGSLAVRQRASVQSARAGSPVRYTVTIRNTGPVGLRRVRLRDPQFAGCDNVPAGSLDPGQRATVTCTVAAPFADARHLAMAVGERAGSTLVTGVSDPVALDIVAPQLTVRIAPESAAPFPGDPVRWVLTVANTGDVTLRGVTARTSLDGCTARIGTLRADEAARPIRCTVPVGMSSLSGVETVTGSLASGDRITAVAAAFAQVRGASGLGYGTGRTAVTLDPS
ncbi:MAG: hypothetical protein QOI35_1886 [Cryptosporangiaceae bacterium]|nr:hypothetical protein [Cryptosporangiaceae bacterium]